MPNDYVEDYEELTGKKPEPDKKASKKVVEAPAKSDAKSSDVKVETK